MKKEPDYDLHNKMVVSNNYIKAIHPDKMNINAMKKIHMLISSSLLPRPS